jgi:hypothetical protein
MQLPFRHRLFGALELSLLLAILISNSVLLLSVAGLAPGIVA